MVTEEEKDCGRKKAKSRRLDSREWMDGYRKVLLL